MNFLQAVSGITGNSHSTREITTSNPWNTVSDGLIELARGYKRLPDEVSEINKIIEIFSKYPLAIMTCTPQVIGPFQKTIGACDKALFDKLGKHLLKVLVTAIGTISNISFASLKQDPDRKHMQSMFDNLKQMLDEFTRKYNGFSYPPEHGARLQLEWCKSKLVEYNQVFSQSCEHTPDLVSAPVSTPSRFSTPVYNKPTTSSSSSSFSNRVKPNVMKSPVPSKRTSKQVSSAPPVPKPKKPFQPPSWQSRIPMVSPWVSSDESLLDRLNACGSIIDKFKVFNGFLMFLAENPAESSDALLILKKGTDSAVAILDALSPVKSEYGSLPVCTLLAQYSYIIEFFEAFLGHKDYDNQNRLSQDFKLSVQKLQQELKDSYSISRRDNLFCDILSSNDFGCSGVIFYKEPLMSGRFWDDYFEFSSGRQPIETYFTILTDPDIKGDQGALVQYLTRRFNIQFNGKSYVYKALLLKEGGTHQFMGAAPVTKDVNMPFIIFDEKSATSKADHSEHAHVGYFEAQFEPFRRGVNKAAKANNIDLFVHPFSASQKH